MIKSIKGMNDILPADVARWQQVEATARRVFAAYGFNELRTPVLERTEVFKRGMGDDTDVVEKQMYTFEDKSGTSLTLRPEATASVLRAVIENGLLGQDPIQKLYSIGPMFRYERPQKGRYRQFHQINVERLGEDDPVTDAETLAMAYNFAAELGLSGIQMEINSLGCAECRPRYKEALLEHLRPHYETLCGDCQRRMENNPLRVLDCKVESCKAASEGAPAMQDNLCEACDDHYATVIEMLGRLNVPYLKNPQLVRGLDYYTRTTFEMTATGGLGSQNAIAGGGRYDKLVGMLDGPETPGIGFAFGFERLIMLLDELEQRAQGCFFVCRGDLAGEVLPLMNELRGAGIRCEAVLKKSFKAQMKRANKSGYPLCIIMGEDEVAAGEVTVKDMDSSDQQQVRRAEAVSYIVNKLGSK